MPKLSVLALFVLGIGLAQGAQAGCSRVINVPIAPIGLSVFMSNDGVISGVYPDLLRRVTSLGGCNFQMNDVPRARMESLFEAGLADVLIPATRSDKRDQFGIFVPLIQSRAMLISLSGERAPVTSFSQILERRELKVALVRGFDYGPAYRELAAELGNQNRLILEKDTAGIGRLLQSGIADATIMAPSILAGALYQDPKNHVMIDRLRTEAISELPWSESGVYLSRTALSDADRDVLREAMERAAKTGEVWRAFQYHYPAHTLTGSIKPR